MHIPISADRRAKLFSALPELAPWMHTYKFDDQAYAGLYYCAGISRENSWCNPESDQALIRDFQRAYEDTDPDDEKAFHIERLNLLDIERAESNVLDIASATGKYSFLSADAGFRHVYSSEIRPHQCKQQRLIIECAESDIYRNRITVSNDAVSADAPGYADLYADKDIDVVLSLGLLYHLANPLQHLLNCREIARKAVIVSTKVHFSPFSTNEWVLKLENREWVTHAFEGVSLTPHYRWIPENAARLGFSSCKVAYPSVFHDAVPGYDRFDRGQRLRLLLGRMVNRFAGPRVGLERIISEADSESWQHNSFHPEWMSFILTV